MGRKFQGDEYRTTTLCIDTYDNSLLTGRFYNQYSPEGKTIQSITQFLVEMNQILDEMDFPSSYTNLRHFSPPASGNTGPPKNEPKRGEVGTFAVRILFRQNASWQGSIAWLEGRQEQSFRSVLELVLLIDNALQLKKTS